MRETKEARTKKRYLRLTQEIRLGRMLAKNVAILSNQLTRIEERYPRFALEG